MLTEKQKMLAGMLYKTSDEGQAAGDRQKCLCSL